MEFLTQDLGRGNRESTYIHKLNIKAQPLRYQHFALDHVVKVDFYGMKVAVTEPVIYLLLKGIISGERPISQKSKAMKDLSVVSSFGHYLISIPEQRKLLQYYYQQMPKP
ncbi:MAG: hypothetical protein ISR78_02965 [Spirochaetia bacterium]|nr:hypothetical protein [Spirochaetia bacterium]